MKRFAAFSALVLFAGLAAARLGAVTTAQDGARESPAPHVLVGSWRFDGADPFLYTFFSDGTAIGTSEERATYHGAWQALDGGRATFLLERLIPSSGTMGEGFQPVIELGSDPDTIPLEDGTLRRIVPDLSAIALAGTPATK